MNSFLRKNFGWVAILLLSLFPAIRWLEISPLGDRFLNFYIAMNSLGQITGLVGMAMFSVSLILAGRFKILDKYFYGLNNVYNHHHVIGAAAFILLLFHPLFLAVKYLQFSLNDAALFLLPSGNWARNYGIISLVSLIVLMVLTFYVQLKYHRWKMSHKFMVGVFVFAVLHSFYAASDISRDNILRVYIFALAAFGLVAGFWQAFLSKHINANHKYKINNIANLGSGIFKIDMAPESEPMKYEPGQFIFINFESEGVSGESHPFSISSSPDENNLQIMVKSLGDYTGGIDKLKIGDKAFAEGPFGKFSYKEASSKNQIWIAGGIGITPFWSMAKSLKDDAGYKINLYYCTKNKEEAVLMDELLSIYSENKKFEAINWRSDESGHITGQDILELSGGVEDKDIFLCGPPAFMDSLRGQFVKLGVDAERIHWEKFNFK